MARATLVLACCKTLASKHELEPRGQLLTLKSENSFNRRRCAAQHCRGKMAKTEPSKYPVWQRFPTRIAAALLAAFSLASLPPIGEWSTSLCDCKAREFLAMIPFAYNDAGAATPDVFQKVSVANPPWESTSFPSIVYLPDKMVRKVLAWCAEQASHAIKAGSNFQWGKVSNLAVDTAGSVHGHPGWSWQDYAHDADDYMIPGRMQHFEDGKCLFCIDRAGSPTGKSMILSAPQYAAKFTDAPSYTKRGEELLNYFLGCLNSMIALVAKVSGKGGKMMKTKRKRSEAGKSRTKHQPQRGKVILSPELIDQRGWAHYLDDASIISVLKAMQAGLLVKALWFSPHVLFCATGMWNTAIAATICQFEVFRILLALNQEVTVTRLRSQTLLDLAKKAPAVDVTVYNLNESDKAALLVLAGARLTKQGKGGLADFTEAGKTGGVAGKLYYKACDDMRALANPYRRRIYAVMHRRGVEGVPATPGPWRHWDLKNRPSSS